MSQDCSREEKNQIDLPLIGFPFLPGSVIVVLAERKLKRFTWEATLGFIYRRKHKYESKLSALLGFGGFADLLVAAFNDKLCFHLVLHVLTLPGGMRESGQVHIAERLHMILVDPVRLKKSPLNFPEYKFAETGERRECFILRLFISRVITEG